MHASLTELLENLRPAVLWVTHDGVVRYANAEAANRTGLATGCRLYDPDLGRAIVAAVTGRVPRTVTTAGAPQAGVPGVEMKCRVIPGLGSDDAFVLMSTDPSRDQGSGYDNLMETIRADLRDPLREARAALSLVEERGALQPEQAALNDGLGQLLTVVERLVELASLWSGDSLLANDRIELWPLLQRVWGEVEPLALQRDVRVRFQAQTETAGLVTLYGSERWLGRVFQECLEVAVRGTRAGGLLDVEHRQLGPRAVVVFRDSGVFAGREQIGLKLCQHIVGLHGGHLREEVEDGVRNFVIDLPSGAPHRSDTAALDIAQAQQYAKDLAALMIRQRRKTTEPQS